MSTILCYVIRLYWRFWPDDRRPTCLFRTTCSRHVYHVTHRQGFVAGLRTLTRRVRQCRPGYTVYVADGQLRVRLADGSSIDAREAAPELLAPYRRSAQLLRQSVREAEGSTPPDPRPNPSPPGSHE